MKKIDCTAAVLLLIAALNCGLMGIFKFDIVSAIFESSVLERLTFGIFGLSAIYFLANYSGIKERWIK